jgi:hypothetical protein
MVGKVCRHATVLMSTRRVDWRLQCCVGPAGHSHDTAIVQGDLTGRCHTADRVQHSRVMGLDVPHIIEGIIYYS